MKNEPVAIAEQEFYAVPSADWAAKTFNTLTLISLERPLKAREVALMRTAHRLLLEATPASAITFPTTPEEEKPHPAAVLAICLGLLGVFSTVNSESSALVWVIRVACFALTAAGVLSMPKDWVHHARP